MFNPFSTSLNIKYILYLNVKILHSYIQQPNCSVIVDVAQYLPNMDTVLGLIPRFSKPKIKK